MKNKKNSNSFYKHILNKKKLLLCVVLFILGLILYLNVKKLFSPDKMTLAQKEPDNVVPLALTYDEVIKQYSS